MSSLEPLNVLDGLTVADELVLLHLYPRPKRDYSLANVSRSVMLGTFADLLMAERVELYEPDRAELTWWRRSFYRNEGAHRFRVRMCDGAPPTGDELLDSVMSRVPDSEQHDLGWWIRHSGKLWTRFSSRLRDRGVLQGVGRNAKPSVDPGVEQKLRQRLRSTLLEPDPPDDHTGTVVLLARAAQLFGPGTGERELVGPIEDEALSRRIQELSLLPSLKYARFLAAVLTQFRIEDEADSTAASTA